MPLPSAQQQLPNPATSTPAANGGAKEPEPAIQKADTPLEQAVSQETLSVTSEPTDHCTVDSLTALL